MGQLGLGNQTDAVPSPTQVSLLLALLPNHFFGGTNSRWGVFSSEKMHSGAENAVGCTSIPLGDAASFAAAVQRNARGNENKTPDLRILGVPPQEIQLFTFFLLFPFPSTPFSAPPADHVQRAAHHQTGLRGRVQHDHGLQRKPLLFRVPRVWAAGYGAVWGISPKF